MATIVFFFVAPVHALVLSGIFHFIAASQLFLFSNLPYENYQWDASIFRIRFDLFVDETSLGLRFFFPMAILTPIFFGGLLNGTLKYGSEIVIACAIISLAPLAAMALAGATILSAHLFVAGITLSNRIFEIVLNVRTDPSSKNSPTLRYIGTGLFGAGGALWLILEMILAIRQLE